MVQENNQLLKGEDPRHFHYRYGVGEDEMRYGLF